MTGFFKRLRVQWRICCTRTLPSQRLLQEYVPMPPSPKSNVIAFPKKPALAIDDIPDLPAQVELFRAAMHSLLPIMPEMIQGANMLTVPAVTLKDPHVPSTIIPSDITHPVRVTLPQEPRSGVVYHLQSRRDRPVLVEVPLEPERTPEEQDKLFHTVWVMTTSDDPTSQGLLLGQGDRYLITPEHPVAVVTAVPLDK